MKEVIILGCGPSHIECPYDKETWGVNGVFYFAKRLDKLFMTDEVSEVASCEYDIVKLREVNPTLVTPVHYEQFRKAGLDIEIFPMDKIMERFPTRFYSNTIAYMLAYALFKGYQKIWLYGIDMMTNTTYIQEKGGVEFWLGVALGMGVTVKNTRSSATAKTWNGKMYGYWGEREGEIAKERLYAPWELVKAPAQPNDEWVLTEDNNWIKLPYNAGIGKYQKEAVKS